MERMEQADQLAKEEPGQVTDASQRTSSRRTSPGPSD